MGRNGRSQKFFFAKFCFLAYNFAKISLCEKFCTIMVYNIADNVDIVYLVTIPYRLLVFVTISDKHQCDHYNNNH